MIKNGHPFWTVSTRCYFSNNFINKKTLQTLHGISEAVNFITVFSIERDARRRGRGPQQSSNVVATALSHFIPPRWLGARDGNIYFVCLYDCSMVLNKIPHFAVYIIWRLDYKMKNSGDGHQDEQHGEIVVGMWHTVNETSWKFLCDKF